MSAVCVLTPIVIGTWPVISSAVMGAVTSLGFSGVATTLGASVVAGCQNQVQDQSSQTSVEVDVPNSNIVAESIVEGETITVQRDNVTVQVTCDDRGACKLCVSGQGTTKELKAIGEEVAGRIAQQFIYNKLVTELKKHNYEVIQEDVRDDMSINVRVRHNG